MLSGTTSRVTVHVHECAIGSTRDNAIPGRLLRKESVYLTDRVASLVTKFREFDASAFAMARSDFTGSDHLGGHSSGQGDHVTDQSDGHSGGHSGGTVLLHNEQTFSQHGITRDGTMLLLCMSSHPTLPTGTCLTASKNAPLRVQRDTCSVMYDGTLLRQPQAAWFAAFSALPLLPLSQCNVVYYETRVMCDMPHRQLPLCLGLTCVTGTPLSVSVPASSTSVLLTSSGRVHMPNDITGTQLSAPLNSGDIVGIGVYCSATGQQKFFVTRNGAYCGSLTLSVEQATWRAVLCFGAHTARAMCRFDGGFNFDLSLAPFGSVLGRRDRAVEVKVIARGEAVERQPKKIRRVTPRTQLGDLSGRVTTASLLSGMPLLPTLDFGLPSMPKIPSLHSSTATSTVTSSVVSSNSPSLDAPSPPATAAPSKSGKKRARKTNGNKRRALQRWPVRNKLSQQSRRLVQQMSDWIGRYLGCAVCGDQNAEVGNELVGCSGCDLFVHKFCYGISEVPTGDWYCDWCQEQNKKLGRPRTVHQHGPSSAECVLCPVTGGAVVRVAASEVFPSETPNGKAGNAWAHVTCALHLDEVSFEDAANVRLPAVQYVDAERFRQTCEVCKAKAGAVVRCEQRPCKRMFHVMCAKRYPEAGCKALMAIGGRKLVRCATHFSLPTGRSSSRRKVKETKTRVEPSGPLLAPSARSKSGRNPWLMHEVIPVYPSDGDESNIWHVVHTTDADSRLAFKAVELLAPRWGAANTDIKASNERTRNFRKCVGYSALVDNGQELLAVAQWSVWTVSHQACALNLHFFLTKERNERGVTQRRKKNGTFLTAHLLHMAFSRPEIRYCIVASEQGNALAFWSAIGFRSLTRKEKGTISTVELAELDPYNDTETLIMNRQEYESAEHTVQSLERSFQRWRQFHTATLRALTVTRTKWEPLQQRHVAHELLRLRAHVFRCTDEQRAKDERVLERLGLGHDETSSARAQFS